VLGSGFFGVSPAKLLAVLFRMSSLELDLCSSAGSLKTRAYPRWPPASSGPAAPSHGRVSIFCTVHGLHALGRSLLGLARVGHVLSYIPWLVGIGGFSGRLLHRVTPGEHALAPMTAFPNVSFCLISVWFFCVFCSESAFVMFNYCWTICWHGC
jgi:hypothetical protein